MLRHLTKILQYVVDKSITKTKQLKINDFFVRKYCSTVQRTHMFSFVQYSTLISCYMILCGKAD